MVLVLDVLNEGRCPKWREKSWYCSVPQPNSWTVTTNMQSPSFRFMWPCIINVGEERTNRWHKYRCLFTISLISTCFGHHYAHRQENRLYKPRVVLAWICACVEPGNELSALCECWCTLPVFTQCSQLVSRLHTTAASTSRLIPHAVLYSMFSWRWA